MTRCAVLMLIALAMGCTTLKSPDDVLLDATVLDASLDDAALPDAGTTDAGHQADIGIDAGDTDSSAADSGSGCAVFMPYVWSVETRPNAALSSMSSSCSSSTTTRTTRAAAAAELFVACRSTCTCSVVVGLCDIRRTMVCSASTVTDAYMFGPSPVVFTGRSTYVAGAVTCVSDIVGTWVSP